VRLQRRSRVHSYLTQFAAGLGTFAVAGVFVFVIARPAGDREAGAAAEPPPLAMEITPAASEIPAAEIPPPAVEVVRPAPLITWAPAPSIASTAPPPEIAAHAAIVLDEASAAVLYEKEAHARLAPASLTKIMTALVALERTAPDEIVEVHVDGAGMRRSTVMGLLPGERLTMQALLYGLMLPSGNDAALAIAEHMAGSTQAFAELMNQRAAELGLQDTRFANPHGLDSAGHYTSAYDLALLTRAAMQRQDFRELVDTRAIAVTGALNTYHLGTLNPLYGRIAGVDGVKTGYTRRAQQTIVGSVTRDGHRVFVVLLRSPDRTGDALALFGWSFGAWSWPASPAVVAPDVENVDAENAGA